MTRTKNRSALSFYCSGEIRPSKARGDVLITAGRCTCTTTSCCDTCVTIEISAE